MRALLVTLVLAGCQVGTDEDVDAGWTVDARSEIVDCPNAPGCAPSDDRTLSAGAAVRSIVPDCFESWTDSDDNFTYNTNRDAFLDCGCDRLCPDDPGYPGPDEGEGDGLFRPIWIAGFQNSRPAMGVRGAEQGFLGEGDGLEARALVLDQGATRVALVTLDAIGFMYDETTAMRQAVLDDAALDVDHVIVVSSHSHSAPDAMGIYGPNLAETGFDTEYAGQVVATVHDVVADAIAALETVTVSVGEVDANTYWDNGTANLISDTRDPWIVDPRIGVARFAGSDDHTVATVVHWANHPETIGSDNALMSAGFVHPVRRVVTEGSHWSDDSGMAGIGGVTLFVQGAVGGMMTSLRATVVDPTGASFRDASWDKTDTVGQLVGELALDAVAAATPLQDPVLSVHAHGLAMPVANIGFQAMFNLGVLDHRTVFDYDPNAPINNENDARVHTEVDLLRLGDLSWLSIPGELFPEAAIGGYDGAWLPPQGVDLVDPGNPNPPDLTQAPAAPYLLDRVPGQTRWILGLGNDELGYMMPPFNFELGRAPYLSEAEGDHYEETNSLGPDTLPLVEQAVQELLDYVEGR
ncbi:MAG: hypothetical protein H6733_09960 [Alphaproteobacteria bacterium]|nr:hypothetical protein [Alphaproteobacteria bacterium]